MARSVEQKAELAYFEAHGKPGGGKIYRDMRTAGKGPSEIAREFKVADGTVTRWNREDTAGVK